MLEAVIARRQARLAVALHDKVDIRIGDRRQQRTLAIACIDVIQHADIVDGAGSHVKMPVARARHAQHRAPAVIVGVTVAVARQAFEIPAIQVFLILAIEVHGQHFASGLRGFLGPDILALFNDQPGIADPGIADRHFARRHLGSADLLHRGQRIDHDRRNVLALFWQQRGDGNMLAVGREPWRRELVGLNETGNRDQRRVGGVDSGKGCQQGGRGE